MRPFSIAGIQMYVSPIHNNIPAMKIKLDTLMSSFPWVEMVVFSELAAHGPIIEKNINFKKFEHEFQELAKKYNVWIVPGSMFERVKEEGHTVIYNTAIIINPQGEIVARHRKLFPFLPYEVGVKGGNEFISWDVPNVGKFGISICYDGWFPETTRALVSEGVEVIIHPTMTGTTDREIETCIMRSMAAINQCYFIDINGLGAGGVGRSIICGPKGEVIHQSHGTEELIPIEIDLDQVSRIREEGLNGLGQTLKSFRDRSCEFPQYLPDYNSPYLDSLGALEKKKRKEKPINH